MPRPRKPLSVIDIDDEEEMDLRGEFLPFFALSELNDSSNSSKD